MSLRSSQESTTPDVPMLHKMLIIGGPLAEAGPWLEQSMREVINERALPYHRRQLQIRFSTLGSRSTMLGAAYAATAPFPGRVRVSL